MYSSVSIKNFRGIESLEAEGLRRINLIVGRNNYQTLCFNGETGEIVDLSPELLTLRMEDAQGERLD